MAQWQELLRLDSELQGRVRQLYGNQFPSEIRHYLSAEIESLDWDSAAVDENRAIHCFHALLESVQKQWNRAVQENRILQGPDFLGLRNHLLQQFQNAPLNLAITLSECLKEERRILASVSGPQGGVDPTMEQKWIYWDNKVDELTRQMQEIKKEIKSLEALNEKLDFFQVSWRIKVAQHNGLVQSQAVVEEECRKQAGFISQTTQTLLQQMEKMLRLAQETVETLTEHELRDWQLRQQLACIGAPVDTSLEHLQKWFTTVADVLLQAREQLQKLQEQSSKYSSSHGCSLPAATPHMHKFVVDLLMKLVTKALVVERQPVMTSLPKRPLILKTGVRFTVTVRFLANLPKCLLKVKPVFDKDVDEAKTVKGFRHFQLSREECKMLDEDEGLVAEFGHMSLKEMKGRCKGSAENRPVIEELHLVKFVTRFQHAGLECDIEACSLPVVVISSTTQMSSAWTSIMWYNMVPVCEPRNLSLFVEPPPLTWDQLAQLLTWQFQSVGQRPLDQDQLAMLKNKFVDDPEDLVYWSKFSKSDSAWFWVDGILDLIKKYLVDLWRDGLIMGFVSRRRTEELLQQTQSGTFLMRFSESNRDGAITFSWVEHFNGETNVRAVEPYTKQELSLLSLPDIIYHYSLRAQGTKLRNPLKFLYPDIPKDSVFARYWTPSVMSADKKVVDGYVNRTLLPVSTYPTPPPSPPREPETGMELSPETNAEIQRLLEELFVDVLSEPPLTDPLSSSYQWTSS